MLRTRISSATPAQSQRRRKVGGGILSVSAAVALVLGLVIAPASPALASVQTITYTGTHATWTVPAGVHTVTVSLAGANGGNISWAALDDKGGSGAVLTWVNVPVTPGDVCVLDIGQGGVGDSNGSGGGAASVMSCGFDTTLNAVAGGGGGAGLSGGGNAGLPSPAADGVSDPDVSTYGGHGGTSAAPGAGGAAVVSGAMDGLPGIGNTGGGGGAAVTTCAAGGGAAGGANPLPHFRGGNAGQLCTGVGRAGGGGGGGVYAGGGGAGTPTGGSAGGGGGASSYSVVPAAMSYAAKNTGANGTDGSVTFTINQPTVTTGAATAITPNGATLNGVVNANGADTSSLTMKYSTNKADVDAGSGTLAVVTPAQATGVDPTPVSALAAGLSPATTYFYRLSATSAGGSVNGQTLSFTTLADVPAPPTALLATPGDRSASVAFTPGANNGSAITDYDYRLDGGGWVPAGTAVSPVLIGGLTNGTAYQVELRARNAVGPGATSAPVTVTPRTAPGAPTLTTVTPGDGEVRVDFTPGDNGGSPITNYQFTSDGGGTWTPFAPPVTASPAVITGLVNGAPVGVGLRAVNAVGPGAPSLITNVTVGVPGAPTALSAKPGNGSAVVAFTPGPDNGAPITNYQYSLDGGGVWIPFFPPVTGSPVAIGGLVNGSDNQVLLRAVNARGVGAASAPVSVHLPATPSAPTNLVANPGAGSIALTFTPGADGGLPLTNYEYSLDGGGTWTPFAPADTAPPLIISPVPTGFVYQVAIRAVNALGAGAASAVVPVTVPSRPAAPTALVGTPGDGLAHIAFTPGTDGATAITNYEYTLDGGATWTPLVPPVTAPPVTVPGLVNGTQYVIGLRAVNAMGAGPGSVPVTLTPFTTPSAPTDVMVTEGYGELGVEFTPGVDGGSPITNYEYTSDDGLTWTPFAPPVTGSPVVIGGLTNGVAYSVAVRAVNAAGVGAASATATATPQGAVFTAIDPARAYDSRLTGGPLASGQSRQVNVTGGGVVPIPADAVAVAYNLTVVNTVGTGFLAVAPGGQPMPATSTINWAAPGQILANGFNVGITANTIGVFAGGGGSTQFIVDIVGYFTPPPPMPPPASSPDRVLAPATPLGAMGAQGATSTVFTPPAGDVLTPLTPARAYDSRTGAGRINPGQRRTVDVTRGGTIPVPADATAVVYTLTVTDTVGAGYLAVGPAGAGSPSASTINWSVTGQTLANSTVVAVNGGQVDVFAGGGGATNFIVDVVGYYAPVGTSPGGLRFTAVAPIRGYDSRVAEGPLTSGATRATALPGGTTIPADAAGVAVNLTVTSTLGTGFLTLSPDLVSTLRADPTASTINWYAPGQTIANGTTSGVTAPLTLATTAGGGGSTQYILDIAGYYD